MRHGDKQRGTAWMDKNKERKVGQGEEEESVQEQEKGEEEQGRRTDWWCIVGRRQCSSEMWKDKREN